MRHQWTGHPINAGDTNSGVIDTGAADTPSLQDCCTDIQRCLPPLFHRKRKKPWIDVSIQGKKPLSLHSYEMAGTNFFENNSFILNLMPSDSSM
jgi:hypothetical protein